MTLTLGHGPLSGDPPDSNYDIDGPKHRLLFQDFPRRIRARLGGETVLDTRRAKLLHETGLRPQLYVPEADVRSDLLEGATRSPSRRPPVSAATCPSAATRSRSRSTASALAREATTGIEPVYTALQAAA
jgi:hypothetical protein